MPTLGIIEKMYPWTESPHSIHAAETLSGKELYKLRKPGSLVNYEASFQKKVTPIHPVKCPSQLHGC